VSHLWEIGCKAFVLVQVVHTPKIYSWLIECVLVGYSPNSKAYRCYDRKASHIIISRNIQFIEVKDSRCRPLHPSVVANEENDTETDEEDAESTANPIPLLLEDSGPTQDAEGLEDDHGDLPVPDVDIPEELAEGEQPPSPRRSV
jgi:hypothetical protein